MCATEDIDATLQVPRPTGDLFKAMQTFGDKLRTESCTLTGWEDYYCPYPDGPPHVGHGGLFGLRQRGVVVGRGSQRQHVAPGGGLPSGLVPGHQLAASGLLAKHYDRDGGVL